jgi:hypothetical protein
MPAPWLLAIALLIGLLVLLPSRRLRVGGFRARTVGWYAVGLWVLGMALAVRPMGTRFLVPILLLAYLAPFVAGPEQWQRLRTRTGRRGAGREVRPIKDVTPTEEADRLAGR